MSCCKDVEVKILSISEDFIMPKKATDGSACYDLYSVENIDVAIGEVEAISLGFCMEIPKGYEFQIRCRSGIGKRGIIVSNGIGTIDSDYRGEVKVLLLNLSKDVFRINKGDRIAQGVINKLPLSNLILVDELTDTNRGSGGFGSTGIN